MLDRTGLNCMTVWERSMMRRFKRFSLLCLTYISYVALSLL